MRLAVEVAVASSPFIFHGKPAAQVFALELTESMLMQNVDGAVHALGELKSLGVHISLDDFGIGYSSLSYLTWPRYSFSTMAGSMPICNTA